MPIAIPIGVAIEKVKINHLTILKSFGKAFTKLMPRAEEAAPLWMKIASIMESAEARFCYRPSASPSKQACTERAIIRMKGVMLQHFDFFYSISS